MPPSAARLDNRYYLGAVAPSLPDSRDTEFPVGLVPGERPRRHFATIPVPKPQGAQNSCVAHALAYAGKADLLRNGQDTDLSRAFLYQEARGRQGWRDQDSGCYVRDAVSVMESQGSCSENVMPYSEADFQTRPTADNYAEAERNRVCEFHLLPNADTMVAACVGGHVTVCAFTVYESFSQTKLTGLWTVPSGAVVGGHAVATVGYDLDDPAGPVVWLANSWGEWGVAHPLHGTDSRFDRHGTGFFRVPFSVWNGRDFWDRFSVHFRLET